MMNEGDIVVVLTAIGEFVGEMSHVDNDSATILNPRAFMQTQEGMGFAPTISFCSEENLKKVVFSLSAIVAVVPARKEVADAWRQTVTGIVTASSMPK